MNRKKEIRKRGYRKKRRKYAIGKRITECDKGKMEKRNVGAQQVNSVQQKGIWRKEKRKRNWWGI